MDFNEPGSEAPQRGVKDSRNKGAGFLWETNF